MSSDEQLTREVERETVEIVTETDEEYRCRQCDQWFRDEDQMVPVQVGRCEAARREQYCLVCAEGVFGYEPEHKQRGLVWTDVGSRDLDESSSGVLSWLEIESFLVVIETFICLTVVTSVAILSSVALLDYFTSGSFSFVSIVSSDRLLSLAGLMIGVCIFQIIEVMKNNAG